MVGIARARRNGTPIDFYKRPRGRYHSILHRHDGVLVQLEGGSYNRVGGAVPRVPHDIAHLIVEDAFGLRGGLWGTLAGGGLVQNATFAGGRKPPHAERRAWEITDRAGETLRQAEVVVRAVADWALADRARDLQGLRARVGDRWWSPGITVEALERACRDLREAATPWDALAEGASLRLTWPRT
ncbi:MAG TPA: hypothetical protein VFX51_18135 [Solirubrobacteraceae bacterium]|nr:hypothetical protein [Solirubrobacteraceae bacterium]